MVIDAMVVVPARLLVACALIAGKLWYGDVDDDDWLAECCECSIGE